MEVKTRVKPLTIKRAEDARRECGRVVWCYFDDDTFKKCVPAANRQQVLHQAAVTKLSVGIFVTAKVEENQGSIVQIVIAKITPVQRVMHVHKLLPVAETIIGWVYNDDNISRGRLREDDMPNWMLVQDYHVLQSRVKLLYAHYKFIRQQNNTFQPTQPLLLYKHHVQLRYNQGKPRLDKNTEMALRVHSKHPSPFESKYVLLF